MKHVANHNVSDYGDCLENGFVKRDVKMSHFGRPESAELLKAARVAAGYKSAAAAALEHGWSESTLRGHESGSRNISRADAEKYSAALNVSRDALLGIKSGVEIDREIARLSKFAASKERSVQQREDRKSAVAARLRFARILRGFSTLTDASKYLGLNRATAGMHENGYNAISEPVAEAYALAYGINLSWLVRRVGPSGLGDLVDERIADIKASEKLIKVAPECSLLATKLKPIDNAQLAFRFENTRSPSEAGTPVYEGKNGISHSVRDGLDGRSWILPSGIMSKLLDCDPTSVSVFTIDRPQGHWIIGDRVFVDQAKRDVSSGGHFAYFDADKVRIDYVHPSSRTQDTSGRPLIGKVVATFALHAHRSAQSVAFPR